MSAGVRTRALGMTRGLSSFPGPETIGYMLDGPCAYCATHTHFTARWGAASHVRRLETGYWEANCEIAATCDNCGRINTALGRYSDFSQKPNSTDLGVHLRTVAENLEGRTMAPPLLLPADTEYLPDDVAGFVTEAHHAHSIGAYRAVLLLVRSTIEAAAKTKGVKTGNLFAKIDALASNQLIRPGTKQLAHALRILGNDIAHGDIGEVPTEEDAEDSLRILRLVLDDLFVAEAIRVDMLTRRGKYVD